MSSPRPPSAEQCAFFQREGYLIVPDVFDPADLEPVRQALHREIAKKAAELKRDGQLTNLHEELAFDQRLAAIQQDSKENGEAIIRHREGLRGGGFHARELFDVIAHPKLLAAVGSLLATDEIVASSVYRIRPKLPNSGRGIVPWHQDSGYFAEHCDTQLIITCWVPLVDANVANLRGQNSRLRSVRVLLMMFRVLAFRSNHRQPSAEHTPPRVHQRPLHLLATCDDDITIPAMGADISE